MQNTLVIWLWLLAGSLFSQAPQRISYQGVARSSSGTVLSNTTIAVRFQIHQSSPSGLVVFTEEHQGADALSTNAFGLFTTAIGRITNLSTVNWENGPFFIEVSIDPANGTSYSSVGTQQLMSVPYALYAAKAGNATPVPTIAINAPNTVSNPSAGTYSINIPAAQSYTAGSGIDITGGIISTTLSVPSPTISGVGQATVTSPSSNTYLVEVPTPTLSISGNSLSISPGNTQVLPSATLTPGNSYLSISGSANDYTLTPITPTLNVTGGSLAGAYPSQTLTIPSSSTTLVQGNNISLTQSGSTYTLSSVTPTLNVSGGSLAGAYPSQTLTIPSSSTTLVQGNNINLTQSGNTYTLSAVTPTLNVSGGSLAGAYPSQTLTIPSSSTTLVQGNNINLTQSGNTYTLSAVTPTLNVTGGSLTGTYPSQTLTIPSSSTTLVQGNNISLTQSGNTYTLSSVTPTLNVTGGSLAGAYPSQTLTIPSSSTTLVQGNNISLTQSGNTYTLSSVTPTLTAGSNVTVTPVGAANAYTISAGLNNYTGTTGNISVAGNTVNLIATGITAGTYGASAGNLVPVFTVDNFGRLTSAGQYTPGLLGDVTGTINATTVGRLRGIPVSTTAPVAGDVLGYDGSSWAPTAQPAGWRLNGNTGTTASNFLGTTDNRALVLKTDNEERAKFSTDNQLTLFSGDNSNPGKLNFNGNFSNTIRVLEITTGNNGSALSVIAGDARSGTGNSTGGNLNLSAGAATGNGSSVIDFLTAGGGTTGSARVNPLIRMRLNESGQLLLGPTSGFSPNSKLVIEDGHIESKQTNSPAIAGAGSLLGLSGSSATLSSNATDVAGTIFIYTGLLGGGGKGNYATITFDKTYANPPVVILTPRTEDSAGLRAYVTGTTGSGFTLAFSTGTAGLTTYEFNYMVLEVN